MLPIHKLVIKKNVYYNQAQLDRHPLEAVIPANSEHQLTNPQYKNVTNKELTGKTIENSSFLLLEDPTIRNKKMWYYQQSSSMKLSGLRAHCG
ncbi:hypothetical protein [Paucilactobacillus hokkaidonensis]|uniref:hypothetical protein n=1 Tax=Paucilactobacillus hokkaidonensis TaxID=1193095 RepID=UPI0006D2C99C|nr:hypothetical protein [Paucilactobacillus hokkaidonensis]